MNKKHTDYRGTHTRLTYVTTHECTLHTGTVGIIAGTMESCPPPAQAQLAQHILYSRHETTNI